MGGREGGRGKGSGRKGRRRREWEELKIVKVSFTPMSPLSSLCHMTTYSTETHTQFHEEQPVSMLLVSTLVPGLPCPVFSHYNLMRKELTELLH